MERKGENVVWVMMSNDLDNLAWAGLQRGFVYFVGQSLIAGMDDLILGV